MGRLAKPGTSSKVPLRRCVYRPEVEGLEYRFYPGTVMDMLGWSALGSGVALLAWDRLAGALDSLRGSNRDREGNAFLPISLWTAPTQNLEVAPSRFSSDDIQSINRGSSNEGNGYFNNQVEPDRPNGTGEDLSDWLWSQTELDPLAASSPPSKGLSANPAGTSEANAGPAGAGSGPTDTGSVSSLGSSTPYRVQGNWDGAGSSYGPSLYFSPPAPNVSPPDSPASDSPANTASAPATSAPTPGGGGPAGPLGPSGADVTTTYTTAVPCNYWQDPSHQPADAFQVIESGGHDPGRGTVTQQAQGCDYIFSAGNSHLVSLQRTFQIPGEDPRGAKEPPHFLDINYADAMLDGSAPARMKDAFEAALLDDQGRPLTNTIAPGRDAFFNLTAGQAPLVPREGGVTVANQHVIVDISNLVQDLPFPRVTIALRLIHNTGNPSTSSIHIIGQHPNVYRVPGNMNTRTQLSFNAEAPWGETNLHDEVGYYVVDNRDGVVNGRAPGDTDYRTQVLLRNPQPILRRLPDGTTLPPFQPPLLPAGTFLATYIVQNATMADVQICSSNCPHWFVSYRAANPDTQLDDHILKAYGSGGGTWIEPEDVDANPSWPQGEPNYGDLPASIHVTGLNLSAPGGGGGVPGPNPGAGASPKDGSLRPSGSAPPPRGPALKADGPYDLGPLDAGSLPGTDYWLTFPGAFPAARTYQCGQTGPSSVNMIGVTSEFTTDITVSSGGTSQTYTVTPGSVKFLSAGSSLRDVLDVPQSNAAHITAPKPVTVYGMDPDCYEPNPHWQNGYLALETGSLGTSYVVLAYPNATPAPIGQTDDDYGGTQFAFVATAPGTNVTITPSVDLPSPANPVHPRGMPYTIMNLIPGQTYQQRTVTYGADLTGTTITSNQPIAVFGGHKGAFVPGSAFDPNNPDYSHRNTLLQELPPTVSWGRTFVTFPMGNRAQGDAFRFLTSADNTHVTVTEFNPDGSTATTTSYDRNARQVVDYVSSRATYITSNQPILVAQFSQSAPPQSSILGDPSMMLIPPTPQFLKDYRLATWTTTNGYLNVIAPTSQVSSLRLDEAPLDPRITFRQMGTSGFSGATIDLTFLGLNAAYHHLTGSVPFGAWVYGFSQPGLFGQGLDYSYPAGMQPLPWPTIRIVSPNNGSSFPDGTTVLVTGIATPGLPVIPITHVTVNGTPVEALDPAGNFFTHVTVHPGDNVYQFTATDLFQRTASVTWTLHGTQQPPGSPNFDDSSDVTVATTPLYATTSFNQTTNIVYADLAIKNTGQYTFDAPLLVGVRNLRDVTYDGTNQVTVMPRDTDGTMPDGTPYYIFSRTAPHVPPTLPPGALAPNDVTDTRSIAFYNPNRRQFTYDLVVLGHIHQPPRFTTAPIVQAFQNLAYIYNVGAVDPEGTDTLTYSLQVAPGLGQPGGMTINSASGVVTWTNPAPINNTFPVVIRVTNQHGGYAEQSFVLSVLPGTANVPPVFTSVPVVAAYPNVGYSYQPTVQDPDGDLGQLTWTLDPASLARGMSLNPTTHLITWTPRPDQLGTFQVVLTVSEPPSRGGIAKQSYCLNVAQPPSGPPGTPLNLPPVITSPVPPPALINLDGTGRPYQYQVRAQSPYGDMLTYTVDASSMGRGLNIDPNGLLTWNNPSIPAPMVTITVSGNLSIHPTTAQQSFTLAVNSPPASDPPPRFATQPRTHIGVGVPYRYVPIAVDDDNDSVPISLQQGPAGMDFTGGAVRWTPTINQVGPQTVTVAVSDTDSRDPPVTQQYTINVVREDSNQPPTINSVPPTSAFPGTPYLYDATASDPDRDPVVWRLDTAPWGMSINPTTGTIRWTPNPNNDQVGPRDVVLRASDPFGAFVTQHFTINVGAVHRPPVIASTPAVVTGTNSPYVYAVRVVNPESDPLSFSLSGAPAGMSIDPVTGILRWPTPVFQAQPYTLTIRATDTADPSNCAWSEQTYQLMVSNDPTSDPPPVILSRPADHVLVNTAYDFPIIASDAAGDNVTFSIAPNSVNMTINPTTGVMHLPAQASTTTASITITAADNDNEASQLTYTLTVGQAAPPVFNPPSPPAQITGGLLYRYDAYVTGSGTITFRFDLDPSGTPVAPNGMTVDNLGRITWRAPVLHNYPPPADPPLSVPVRLVATDVYSQSVTLAFTIQVVPDTEPPHVSVQVGPNPPYPGQVVFIFVQATDNVGVTALRLQLDGQDVPLNGQSYARFDSLSVGDHTMQGFANDAAGNVGTSGVQHFSVLSHGPVPPTVDFTNISSLGTITEPVAVTGDVAPGNPQYPLTRWYLRLAPVAGGQPIYITDNRTDEVHGVLGTVDPTLVPDGPYYLQLHADVANGGGEDGVEITVNVRGRLKLGDFKISFTDLTVPVAGIPISVRRTYDSLQANTSRDLGYGWKLEFGDADLKVDFRDHPFQAYGQYPAFSPGEHIVVSRAGADPEGFSFMPIRVPRFPLADVWHPYFQPDPGVTSQLRVQDAELTYDSTLNVFYSLDTGDQIFYNPANRGFGGVYDLITLDGIDHRIDAVTGKLLSLSDRHHNALTFSRDGITSNRVLDGRALGITFERDGQGRIRKIYDPRGTYVEYQYDGHGDLVNVWDRLRQLSHFDYDNSLQPTHRLITITDPLNQQPLQVAYNPSADHRLRTLTDAAGKTTQLGYTTDSVNHIYKQSITDPTQKTTTLSFDTRGNVTDVVDQAGQHTTATYQGDAIASLTQLNPGGTNIVTRFQYDDLDPNGFSRRGLPARVIDGDNKTTSYTYNDFGQVLTVTDPLQHTLVNTYDPQTGDLLAVQPPATSPTNYLYDALGDVTATTFGGATTTYMYDPVGRLTATISPTGVERDTHYDRNGNRTEEDFTWVDPDGIRPPRTLVTSMVYDANDRLTVTVDPESQQTRYIYDALNRVKQTTDIYGGVSATKYDKRGLVVEQTTPLGSVTRTVYDDDGRPLYVTDAFVPGGANDPPNGTHNHYDDAGRVDRVERVQALRISIQQVSTDVYTSQLVSVGAVYSTSTTHYNALGQVDSTTDAAQLTTTFQYNGRGQQTLETVVIGGTPYNTRTDYDDAGRATQVTDRASHLTTTTYDDAGRPTQVTYADNKFTSTHYDPQGRKDWQEDELRHRTTFTYDTFGRLRSVIQPQVLNPETGLRVSPVTSYDYDNYGNLKKITDAKSRQTNFAYDEYNRQVKRTLPDSAFETTVYNALGQLFQRLDFKGQKIEYVYDPGLNRVHFKKLYAAGAGTPTETVEYLYDALGRVTSVNQPSNGVSTYTYDTDSRLQRLNTPQGGITYTYDPATGRHTGTTTNNSDFSYSYDVFSHVQTVTVNKRDGVVLSTPEVSTYIWDPVGTLNNVQHPTGITTVYGYDPRYRVQSLTQQQGAGQVAKYVYGRQDDGKITHVDEYGSNPATPTLTLDYVYDELGRLTRECTNAATGACAMAPGDHTDYSLDLVGNRLTKTKVTGSQTETTTWRYNPRDEIIDQVFSNGGPPQTTVFGYDANGSVISQTTGSQSTTYDYDLQNRLSAAHLPGSVNTSYRYNDDGLRVQEVNGADVKNLLVDGNNPTGYAQVMEERNSDLSLRATYVYGLEPLSQSQGGVVSHYLTDAHSGVRILTSGSGAILNSYRYDAYGNLTASTGTTVNYVLYRGERFDAVLRQYYFRARMYDPATGRFTATDPLMGKLSHPLTLHGYVYANADPIDFLDPSGQESFASLLTGFSIQGIFFRATLGGTLGAIDAVIRGYPFWEGALWGALFGIAGPLIPFRVGIALSLYGVGEALADGNYPSALFRGATSVFGLGTYRFINELLPAGRLGSVSTRLQNVRIVAYLRSRGWNIRGGGNVAPEEYIAGPNGGTRGSTYVDITAEKVVGGVRRTLRVQTVSTRADGVTPRSNELAAAARIKQQFPEDHLLLVPKTPQDGALVTPPPFGSLDDDGEP